MKYKKKNNKKRIWRKEVGNSLKPAGEWSRMVHFSWIRNLMDKMKFKKGGE